ncbi:MAG: TIGR00730 family Rossman fold protein [Chlorobiaceae bacterium]|nr:TIGR00730 family Rossman fold protein [Chlorobiaceae bacterium]
MTANVTVYCSSSNNAPGEYFSAAEHIGQGLARRNIGLVYGGGKVGLMGCIADAVMRNGGTARGIIPRFLEQRELAHHGLSELHIVETMHERKMMLAEWGDAFLVLPGGFGTIDELMEAITWKHLGHHKKPILLLNINGFWDPLTGFFREIASQKMASPDYAKHYTVCSSADEVLGLLDALPASV